MERRPPAVTNCPVRTYPNVVNHAVVEDSDGDLWARVLSGDGRAFGLVFDRHRDRVFRHLGWLGAQHSDAEDLTATVFLELWRRRAHATIVDDTLLPWLLATATNVARNASRARRRYRRLLSTLPLPREMPDPSQIAEDRLAFSARAVHIAAAVQTLALVDQQLIVLTVLEGLSLEHASQALGLSYGAAKTRLSRARRRLSKATDLATLGVTP